MAVSEIMTPAPLITIDLDASTSDAAGLMLKHNIRRLPVVKDGALGGDNYQQGSSQMRKMIDLASLATLFSRGS